MARIHIVDDDADIRQVVMYHLVEDGHEVSAAGDASDLLQTLVLDAPDLLVLDLMLPAVDGFTVLAEMTAAGLEKTTRVLVLSARTSEHDREEALRLGAHSYMSKPFDPEDLTHTVRDLLAASLEELSARREQERETTHLLSQLETLFGE